MSEPIPESIPTSATHSHRPTKRLALTPRAAHATSLTTLFANPQKPIHIPSSTALNTTTPTTSQPPEIVANVQGSSAGAGSGEFHVYKASRRREYERLRAMDDEVQREGEEREFLERRRERERLDADKTERNRVKRAKALARKKGKKGGEEAEGARRKLVPSKRAAGTVAGEDKDEDGEGEERAEVRSAEEIGLVIRDDD